MSDAKPAEISEQLENKSERDHVRIRTGTYLGGTGSAALAHTIHEIIDNVADLWLEDAATQAHITIDADSRVTVRDDGRGIPLGEVLIAGTGRKVPGPQAAFTEMRTGSKFSEQATSGGMNGMGLKALTFMAREVNVEVRRDGKIYTQTFRNGRKGSKNDVLTIDPPVIKPYKGKDTGTSISYLYDDSVFDADARVDGERIQRKAVNASRLCPGLTFFFEDKRTGEKHTFVSDVGLPDFVKELNEGESVLFKDIIDLDIKRTMPDANSVPAPLELQLAFQPAAIDAVDDERGYCFTNMVHNPDGGYHLIGFRKGLARALNSYFNKSGLFKANDSGFDNSDVMQGLAFVISLRMPSPGYESQTKKSLTSAWIERAVAEMAAETFLTWLTDHPNQAKLWHTYLTEIRKARLAMLAERRVVKAKIGGAGLDPLLKGLVRETIKDPIRGEIYFVEGESAGGSAKQARDRAHQSVAPFKGKMLNVLAEMSKGPDGRKKSLENEDVRRIATALETGMGQHFDIEKLRYHKIILMADADADGGHITFLWLGALWTMFPELLRKGHVFIAIPPLYSVYDNKIKGRHYFYNDAELLSWTKGKPATGYTVTRFKGLGEMEADVLKKTAMNPATRRLKQVVTPDLTAVRDLLNELLGSGNADKRKAFMDLHCRGMSTREAVELTS